MNIIKKFRACTVKGRNFMKLKDGCFYKTFFRLFAIVALQNIIVFSVNLADSLMLGTYSEVAMSGVSLANQVQFLLQCSVGGVGNGLSVIASQYWGKKQTDPIKKIFSCALWSGVVLSGILSVAVLLFPSGILGILSNESEIVAAGAEYIRIMAWTYIIFGITTVLTALMRSVESVAIGFVSSVLALVVNISLNYGLIYGHFGMPEMGAKGAAWATFASRVIELLAVLVYALFVDKKLGLKIKDFFIVKKTYLKDYLKAGLPLVGSGSSWGIAMSVQTAIIGRLGAAAIGANAIASPIFQLVAVLYTSSSNAASVIIAKTVGEGDVPRVKRYAKKLQIIFVITGLVSCGGMFLMKNAVIGMYNVAEDTRALAEVFINILAFTVIGSAYEAPSLCGIVSGGGNTKFVFCNDLVFMWGLVLPMSILSAFVFHWPVAVTFFILKADQIAKCFVAVPKVNRFKWMRKLTRDSA